MKETQVVQFILDLSKALDSVDRNILLRKLECYDVRGNMHLLISSYLDGRKQFVSFGGYESTCEKCEVGIPQSSVLGPLLFLILINDLQNSTSLKVINFADDTMLYKTFTKDTYLNDSKTFNAEL